MLRGCLLVLFTMACFFVRGFTAFLFAIFIVAVEHHNHNETFTPNAILSVTRRNINIGGMYRYTTLVNDTLPGPTIRIPENQVFWVRVYNDMTDSNLTMVIVFHI